MALSFRELSEPSEIEPRYWLVVPAAGVGARMGANCPKQYLPLLGKTIIEHTLERLLELTVLEKIIVALSPNDAFWPELEISHNQKVIRVDGGFERADSVLKALQSLDNTAKHNDWVLVHDAARPCVTVAAIMHLIETCVEHSVGGILGVPVTDTLKRVNAVGEIETTLDRSVLWQAQTPQMFRYGLLREGLERAAKNNHTVTDEASALEYLGLSPLMVEGSGDNIKVTRPEDLALAEMILARPKKIF